MERMTITLSKNDIDNFERGRALMNMTKSAYVRLLIAEHEERVPYYISHQELISEFSTLNNYVKQMLLSNRMSDVEKIRLFEMIGELRNSVNKHVRTKI